MRTALQFLTILPVAAPSADPGRSAWAFPIVGVLVGLAAASMLSLPFGPLLAILLTAIITGGLHEDGLADVCDSVRGYRTRERMHAILKDSRIGAHGALALVFSVLIRWQALAHLQENLWLRVPAAYGLSRSSMVLLAACSQPAGEGLGSAFVGSLPAPPFGSSESYRSDWPRSQAGHPPRISSPPMRPLSRCPVSGFIDGWAASRAIAWASSARFRKRCPW